jgi:hypothetical protein
MKYLLATIAVLVGTALAADCWDAQNSDVKINKDFMDILPQAMFYGRSEWMDLNAGASCDFYTYGDVFFRSYSTSGISATKTEFKLNANGACTNTNAQSTFQSLSWAPASSFSAEPLVCGYYVKVTNSGAKGMFMTVRSGAMAAMSAGLAAAMIIFN